MVCPVSKFDVFVFPTLFYESLGLVAIEAMACGLPVIASKRGGILDYLHDMQNGFLFEPEDVDELFVKMNHCYDLDQASRDQLI